jgi:serine/threonine protein kinase/tetratricopeptide (TPR) repeat protein
MNEEEIFHQALARSLPEERAAYVEQACGSNRVLRASVEALLRANVGASGFLGRPALGLGGAVEGAVREVPGMVIGPYKLMEQIGEGGMGLVFVAEQQQPVRRKVALKVIKPGMDTREVIARFEAERQALALMDHPNIARVLDAGATGSGRPYFVMELVRGAPVTQFCDDQRLTPRERLGLFVSVCQAVQHAHQKGVIHRDVKPSNVLVTSHDGTPSPYPLPLGGGEGRVRGMVKVIDFGIAKAIGQQSAERTAYTHATQLVGTPLYMSPEQAGQGGLDIDTRTDIYALGVLLYELLTGTTPFEGARLREASYDEMRRIIREEEPPKPSTRISTLGPAAATVSANRRSDPKHLCRLLRGELDWIVMKALEKDRDHRYESANDLALDVQRYMHDEPVLAGPPGAGYRLRKFVRRHRGPVLAAALVLAALLAGLGGTTWGLVRAEWAWQETEAARLAEADAREREARRAEAESIQRKRAERNERRANNERHRAAEEMQIAQAVRRFLQIDLMRQADPRTQADTLRLTGGEFEVRENPTVQELLDRAAAELTEDKIEAKFPNQPRLQAEVLQTLGRTYLGVGDYQKAVVHLARARDRLNRALGPRHAETLTAMHNLAWANRRAGNTAEAIALYEQVRNVRVAELGPTHPSTLVTLHNLAMAYQDAGKTAEAIALFEEVHKARKADFGPTHPDTLSTLNSLAGAYRQARRTAEAIALFEEVHKVRAAELGPTHPDTLATLDNLAGAYREVGRTPEAITLYEKVRAARVAALGVGHPDTLTSSNNLATAYWRARRLDLSVPLFKETLRLSEIKPGPDHPGTLVAMANLGINYRDAGKPDKGIALLEEALKRARKRPGPLPAKLAWIGRALADSYDRDGRFGKSEPLYRELVAQAREQYGEDHPKVTGSLSRLGLNLLRQRKAADAERVLREDLKICEKHAATAWWAFETRALLGGALLAQKKYAEAEPLLRAGYQGLKECAAEIPRTNQVLPRTALDWLIELAVARGDREAAEKWRKEREALTR